MTSIVILRPLVIVLAATLTITACSGGASTTDTDDALDGSPSAAAAGDGDTSPSPADAGGDRVELVVSTALGGPEHFHNLPIIAYLDEVKRASSGEIDYEFFASGALASATEVASALEAGTIDVALFLPGITPDSYPIDTWIGQFAFIGELGPPGLVLERMGAYIDWWMTDGQEVRQAEFVDQGILPLVHGSSPIMDYNLSCTSPVTSLEDAAGKQVRTAGPVYVAEAQNLGMTPVSMPAAEAYEALQRGVVDCIMIDAPDIRDQGFWDVATEFTDVRLPGFANYGLGMSKQTWDSLSESHQEVMWEALPVYIESLAEIALEHQYLFLSEAADHGVSFHEPNSEMEAAVADLHDEMLDRGAGSAPPTVEDAQALLDALVVNHGEWAGIVSGDLDVESFESWREWGDSLSSNDVNFAPLADQFAQRIWTEVLEGERP